MLFIPLTGVHHNTCLDSIRLHERSTTGNLVTMATNKVHICKLPSPYLYLDDYKTQQSFFQSGLGLSVWGLSTWGLSICGATTWLTDAGGQ